MCTRFLAIATVASAIAWPVLAQDFDDQPWTRTELRNGDLVWIASGGGPLGLRVLRVNASRPGRYVADEYRFDCDGGVQTSVVTFGNDGPGPEPEPKAEREVRRSGVEGDLFAMACEGLDLPTDAEVGSAREALAYRGGQARRQGWNPPSRDRDEDREPREPQEPREPPPGG